MCTDGPAAFASSQSDNVRSDAPEVSPETPETPEACAGRGSVGALRRPEATPVRDLALVSPFPAFPASSPVRGTNALTTFLLRRLNRANVSIPTARVRGGSRLQMANGLQTPVRADLGLATDDCVDSIPCRVIVIALRRE